MKKRILAMVMAAVMAMTFVPVNVANAAEASAITSTAKSAAKVAKVKSLKAEAAITSEYGLKYSWKKVSGAKYQYRVRTAKGADFSKIKTTNKNTAKVSLPSYGEVTFQVRAVKTVDGKKVKSAWTTKKLSSTKLDRMMEKACGVSEGYIKDGVRFEGGMYSSDNSASELAIAIFRNSPSNDSIVYVIREAGKIVDYGTAITAKQAKLADGTEYVQLSCKINGTKDATYGYNLEKGFMVNASGKKLNAKEIADLDYAWDIMSMAY